MGTLGSGLGEIGAEGKGFGPRTEASGGSETPMAWELFPYWDGGKCSGFPLTPDLLGPHME